MFGINSAAAQFFYARTPETFKAMQHLVMALDDFTKSSGKKSWFGSGQDKTMRAIEKAAIHIGRTTAMHSDGVIVIAPQTSATEIHGELQERLDQFFEAFPNWIGARTSAMVIFAVDMSKGIVRTHVDMYSRI
jgi:hypothetical protein